MIKLSVVNDDALGDRAVNARKRHHLTLRHRAGFWLVEAAASRVGPVLKIKDGACWNGERTAIDRPRLEELEPHALWPFFTACPPSLETAPRSLSLRKRAFFFLRLTAFVALSMPTA
jgi:hypothetical protein